MTAKQRVHALLDHWERLLTEYREVSLQNVCRIRGGPEAQVCEKESKPLVMDQRLHRAQQGIQTELASILTTHREIVWATPILPGDWQALDYLDLYVEHYRLVIEKLRHTADIHLL